MPVKYVNQMRRSKATRSITIPQSSCTQYNQNLLQAADQYTTAKNNFNAATAALNSAKIPFDNATLTYNNASNALDFASQTYSSAQNIVTSNGC